jgi:hypothetical protein
MRGLQKGLLAFATAVYASGSSPARAEITVTKSEYRAGVLVVRGETSQSSQRVTLDGRFEERTNKFNEFTFRVRYLPRDCLVTLRAGRETRPSFVANCNAAGAQPPKPLSSKRE